VIYSLTGRSILQKLPKFLQLLHSLWYSTVTTFPFIVTAVFWSLISVPPHKKALKTTQLKWTNISFHCLNSVFAFSEILLSAVLPQRWTHSIIILGIMILYIAMAYIIHLTAHFYVYDFMDTSMLGALAAAYVFGIGGLGVVTFFVVQGLVWMKGAIGGTGVWRSTYDLTGQGFDQRVRVSERTQGIGDKGYTTETRDW